MSTPTTPHSTHDPAAAAVAQRIRDRLTARSVGINVRELIDQRMAGYRGRDTSLVARMSTWRELLGDFTLEQLDADVIHAARSELVTHPPLTYKGLDHQGRRIFKPKARAKTKTPATINRYMAAISGLFTWAIEERLAPRGWVNPCRGVRRMREPEGRVRFLDDAERTRLLEACRASRYPRLYALVLMAMLTGARRGELLALRWRDLDLEAGLGQLGRSKNGDRRTLVLLPQVVAALRPFAEAEALRFVFGSPRARNTTPAAIDTAWRNAVERAQVEDFRFHDLRHCCASYLAQAGVPLNVIAEVLGHRKLDMTRRYAHLTVDTKAQAMLMALGRIDA